jgi:curli biogenesis system outer membrane secretion channel CsgG
MKKILLTVLLPLVLFLSPVAQSKITYVDKQVVGIGENVKMALRDALREAISQVNGVTQETNSVIQTIEKSISDNQGDENYSSTNFQELIKEKSKGSVKSYEIIREGKNVDGQYEVEIKATIAKFDLSQSAKRKRIAILPFRQTIENSSIDPSRSTRMLNQALTNYLVQTRKFTVLDRDFDEEVLSELQNLNESSNIEDQAKIGQQLFADYILVGRLETFDIQEVEKKYLTSDQTKIIKTGMIDFNYRVIDVPTKQIKYASSIREEINLNKQKQPEAYLTEQSSMKIGQEILYAIYPILIEQIKGDIAYLGQGGLQIEVGDIYDIYQMTDEIITDSRTGEKLGKMEFKVGQAEIIDKNAKFSIAKINSNDDLSENFKPVKYYVKPAQEQKKEEKESKIKKKKKKIDEVY